MIFLEGPRRGMTESGDSVIPYAGEWKGFLYGRAVLVSAARPVYGPAVVNKTPLSEAREATYRRSRLADL